jgi:hypothetical protein
MKLIVLGDENFIGNFQVQIQGAEPKKIKMYVIFQKFQKIPMTVWQLV